MSSIYVLEPPTKGKVLLNTTAGPLDVELWPKEAPKAVRNFVQLCLDGYYDGTIFHRIIKTFMIQGGDAAGTGLGGESIYGEPFGDEFHSRLRFNHRGLVACANAGQPNSNNSQFFMTLDQCDWLDKKHTIFGKITGDTIFNLLKLGEAETDSEERPLDPPKLISVEVLWNPFDDLFPRQIAVKAPTTDAVPTRKKKAKKELNLLSFGEEAEEEDEQLAAVQEKKIRSSHDVLQDPRLLKSASDASEMDPAEAKRRKNVQASVREALTGSVKEADNSRLGSDEDEADFDKKMRQKIVEKRWKHAGGTNPFGNDSKQEKISTSTSKTSRPQSKVAKPESDEDDDTDDVVAKKEKLSIKKKGLGSEARAQVASTADLDMQLLSPLEQQRAKYKQRKRTIQGRSEATLARLEKFKKVLTKRSDGSSSPREATRAEAKDDADWLAHSLKFEVDPSKQDDMRMNEDPNQYVVHDPLLEKGKEKFNKQQAKMKRRNKEWNGNSAT